MSNLRTEKEMVPIKPEPELPLEEDSDDQGREINIDETSKDNWSEDNDKSWKRCHSEMDDYVGVGVGAMDEDSDEQESFIRIRSHEDDIFKQEEEDDEYDEDEFYDFVIPEVELGIPPSRKRKQDCIATDLPDLLELLEEEGEGGEQDYRIHAETSKSEKRIPLYLLNPDDFNHDISKQLQIRRAIITHRHHQNKKDRILELTDENKKLREHIDALRLKVSELVNRCDCKKNQTANLDVLDVEIPAVPPLTFSRGGKQMLAVPYDRCPLSLNSFKKASADSVKTEMKTARIEVPSSATTTKSEFTPSTTTSAEEFKPLINIRSTRLASLASNVMSTMNSVTRSSLSKPPISKVLTDRNSSSTANSFRMSANTPNSITEAAASRSCFVPKSTENVIKSEPALSTTTEMDKDGFTFHLNAPTPLPLTELVKSETFTPATAPPVSRIVFAKKRGTTSSTIQAVSKLAFGSKTIPPQLKRERDSPLAVSRVAFANRSQQLVTTAALNPPHAASVSNRQLMPQSRKNFKIVPHPLTRNVSNGTLNCLRTPRWKPIASSPTTSIHLNANTVFWNFK